jgi:predicted nucleotidyltransferase
MILLSRVAELLGEEEIDFVVIGASAMAVYGVSRSTYDVDLMTIDAQALQAATWAVLESEGIEVDLRYGDVQDPLRGVVRFEAREQRPVDLIVGHGGWQAGIFDRAGWAVFEGVELPVVGLVDLILLKIYAGGPQDLWDISEPGERCFGEAPGRPSKNLVQGRRGPTLTGILCQALARAYGGHGPISV